MIRWLSWSTNATNGDGMPCLVCNFPARHGQECERTGKLSVVRRQPKLCKRHNGEWYLDPGVPGTSDYVLSLVKELVNGYDIDGIHFDYIRYPEQAKSFPDKNLYNKYGKKRPLAEWRRENINKMVYRIYDWVKSVKPGYRSAVRRSASITASNVFRTPDGRLMKVSSRIRKCGCRTGSRI